MTADSGEESEEEYDEESEEEYEEESKEEYNEDSEDELEVEETSPEADVSELSGAVESNELVVLDNPMDYNDVLPGMWVVVV